MWRRIACLLLLVVAFVIFLPGAAIAADPSSSNDPMSAASPDIPDLFSPANNPNPNLTTYRDNYYLDITTGMFSIDTATNTLANVIFNIQKGLAYLLILAFYYAFEFSFFDWFKDLVELFIGNMHTQVYNNISIIILSCMGLYFFIKTLQRQTIQIWIAFFQTVVILALALYYFTHPIQVLTQVDNGTKEISKMVLAGTSTGQTGTAATVKASNEIWNVFVHKPWQYLEFGNKALAEQKTAEVLSKSPGKERTNIFKGLEKNDQFSSTNMGIKRLGFEIMYLIPMLVTFLILAALCLLVIGFQFLTIIIFLFGVIVFVLALIPSIGPKVLGNWALKVAAAAGTKIILVFFLSMLIAFNSALFTHAEEKGWLVTLLLQLIIYVIIYLKRNDIVEMFMVMKQTIQNPAAANRMIMRAGEGMNYALPGHLQRKSYSNRYMRRDKEEHQEKQRSSTMYDNLENTGTEDSYGSPGSSGRTYERIRVEAPESSKSFEDRTFRTVNDYDNDGIPDSMEKGGSNHPGSQNQNVNYEMKQLLKRAEEVLEKQVEVLKQEAEIKARRRGTAPEYDPRVRKAETREKMNLPRFENKEIQNMAKQIERVERAGGSADNLVKRSHTEPERPKNVISIMERNRERKEQDTKEILAGSRARAEAAARGETATAATTTIVKNENRETRQENRQEKPEVTRTSSETVRKKEPVGVRERKGKAAGNGGTKMRRH